jgi:hypothetical protein
MNEETIKHRIQQNVESVRHRIAEAARRAGRREAEVHLVAVTKYLETDDPRIEALLSAGCRDLGESRPQHLLPKVEKYADRPIRWHMVGHLQRNKVRKVLPVVSMIQSVDSVRLARAIDRIAREEGGEPEVLLEVNVSGDTAKHGFDPDQLAPSLEELEKLSTLRVRGLMAMAGLEADSQATRAQFARLRDLFESLQNQLPEKMEMRELSMGMSRDFEIAVEHGATIVRVGSLLFEGTE